jgi:hypothetical protein
MPDTPVLFLGYPFDLTWIRESVEKASEGLARVEVASDKLRGKPLLQKIEEDMLEKADLCFFDLTTHNPNVAIELGIALGRRFPHGISYCTDPKYKPKPERASSVFTDMEGWDSIRYATPGELETQLRSKLPELLDYALKIKQDSIAAMRLRLQQVGHPRTNVTAYGDVISADEFARRKYWPQSNRQHIVIAVENAGPGVVTNVVVRTLDGNLHPDEQVGPIAPGATKEARWPVEVVQSGYVGLPTRIEVHFDTEGWTTGILTLANIGNPPSWRVIARVEPKPL